MRATLIFDLDGTLSDPFEGIARCYEHALATHGYPVAPRSELAKLIGPPLDDGMRKLGVRDAEIPAVVTSCRVLWGFGSREELEAAKPRYLLETPGELVERLGR